MNIQTPVSDQTAAPETTVLRHDWAREEVEALFALPFNDLIFRAQTVHREWFALVCQDRRLPRRLRLLLPEREI